MNTYISRGLKDLGVNCGLAQGAFYNYPDFSPLKQLANHDLHCSEDLHQHLLGEYNLASLPGAAFGEQTNVLSLRLSGCDYDGCAALNAYQNGEALNEDFVAQYAPHIVKQIEIFKEFVQKIQNKNPANNAPSSPP
jgi:aspartate/methionine/tyrosine aminotransferase